MLRREIEREGWRWRRGRGGGFFGLVPLFLTCSSSPPLTDDRAVYFLCLTFHPALPERLDGFQRNILLRGTNAISRRARPAGRVDTNAAPPPTPVPPSTPRLPS